MAKRLDQILVVDVESTCWEGHPPEGQVSEIIEIGICPVDVTSLERLERRSILVKPTRSTISNFCTELTTLTPAHFEDAGDFEQATRLLKKEFDSKNRLWASWGDYDRRQFERCCREFEIPYPFGTSHLNVKSLFAVIVNHAHELGLAAACEKIGMTLEGTHHRGDDDAWNIAGILCHLLKNSRRLALP